MKIFGFEISRSKPAEEDNSAEMQDNTPAPSSYAPFGGYGVGGQVYMAVGYDGETNMGEMGPIKQYQMDYDALRWRSKQGYIDSDICTAIVDKKVQWVVGGGFKLQSEPQMIVLEMEGIKLEKEFSEKFSKTLEAWWKSYANSTRPDLANQQTLTSLLTEGKKEAGLLGGVLVILRVIGNEVKIQHIDVRNVITPYGLNIQENSNRIAGAQGYDYYTAEGNRVRYGVEIDSKGMHVAYHVRKGVSGETTRVAAYGPRSGMRMAYIVYGKRNEIGDTAGMPQLATIMETAAMMARYNKAAVGSAEERQNIPYFFEHSKDSKQQDPQAGIRAKAFAGNADALAGIPTTVSGQPLADRVAASTKKTVYDLPNEVTIKAIESKQEMDVPSFTNLQIDLMSAASLTPPNVVMSKYEDSFSASRMAGKDWEHTFMIDRADFAAQYLTPIYTLTAYLLVLRNKINAPGLLEAFRNKNAVVISAYLSARWIGDRFPDIDQKKTASYLREMLGPSFAHAPLMTLEAAAEEAGQGDYAAIAKQAADELVDLANGGIKPAEKPEASGKKEKEEDEEEDDDEKEK